MEAAVAAASYNGSSTPAAFTKRKIIVIMTPKRLSDDNRG